jgi:alkylation response protein AidB-like acyl-CoA dehydrogenase
VDLNLSDEQQQLVDSFGALYAKDSPPERVRSAERTGHDPELWLRLQENGALEMAVDERSGGWGASLLDLALVAEQHGRFLGSAPLLEAQAAARLLARLASSNAQNSPPQRHRAKELLESALSGARLVTLALRPPTPASVLALVPAGAIADDVLFFAGDSLRHVALDSTAAGTTAPGTTAPEPAAGNRRAATNIGSLPLADVDVPASATTDPASSTDPARAAEPASATELASGPAAAAAFDHAVNEWMILMAGALVGLATRSIEIGVDYVKERKAFGVPIGSFQAVSHGLADAATALDGATLLAREAAWSAEVEPERTPELGPLAFGFATETAREASYRSLHYHGGYGFMLEYDIQLYFRRARGWPAQFAEPDVAYAMAAARRLAARSAADLDGED